jgi:glycopeptide antibiotics resistance protein
VVALISPLILNVLLFLPWGFLAFIALDTPERPASQSYLLTILLALGLSLGVEATQYFLPDRVTDVNDVIWNSAGALAGAVFGHLRKRVRVAFE